MLERSRLIEAYHRRLTDPDPAVHLPAARAWTTWEAATSTLEFDQTMVDDFSDPAFALAFARIENHYFYHKGWMEDGQLLRDAERLAGIAGTIVHGRYDMPCPARYAYELHKAWPDAEFHLVEGAGHAFSEPAILDQLIRATDRFANE